MKCFKNFMSCTQMPGPLWQESITAPAPAIATAPYLHAPIGFVHIAVHTVKHLARISKWPVNSVFKISFLVHMWYICVAWLHHLMWNRHCSPNNALHIVALHCMAYLLFGTEMHWTLPRSCMGILKYPFYCNLFLNCFQLHIDFTNWGIPEVVHIFLKSCRVCVTAAGWNGWVLLPDFSILALTVWKPYEIGLCCPHSPQCHGNYRADKYHPWPWLTDLYSQIFSNVKILYHRVEK
jgi:hypothetical protein